MLSSLLSHSLSFTLAPAGSPLKVTAHPINPNRINVTWEPPLCHLQNGPIRSYTIVQTIIKFDESNSASVPAGQLTHMLTNVPPFRNNSIIVRVTNDNGSVTSDTVYAHVIGSESSINSNVSSFLLFFSLPLPLSPSPSQAPNQVQGLGDLSLSITTITLEWDPPKDRSGIDIADVFNRNLTYILRWYHAPADQTESVSGDPIGEANVHSSTRYSVQYLLPNTTYRIYVFAKSSYAQETGGSFVDKKTVMIGIMGG